MIPFYAQLLPMSGNDADKVHLERLVDVMQPPMVVHMGHPPRGCSKPRLGWLTPPLVGRGWPKTAGGGGCKPSPFDLWLCMPVHLGQLGCVASFEVQNDPPPSHAQLQVQLKTHNVPYFNTKFFPHKIFQSKIFQYKISEHKIFQHKNCCVAKKFSTRNCCVEEKVFCRKFFLCWTHHHCHMILGAGKMQGSTQYGG